MEWIQNNWIFILVGIAFIAMHMFGHGGHGGHRKRDPDPSNDPPGDGHASAEATGPMVADMNKPKPAATTEKQHKH